MSFAVIIAGCRTFDDYELLREKCDFFFSEKKPTAIICGEAKGADSLGKRYAEEHGIPVESFPADWDKHGRAAGPIRNAEMLRHADAVIAFWDGQSRGTRNMIDITRKAGKPIRIVHI